MGNRKNILIVDKDNVFLHALKNAFAAHAATCQVAFATTTAKALTILEKFVVHLMAVNINLSGESGIDLLFDVRQRHPSVHVILYTEAEIHDAYKRTLLYGGAAAVLQKPFQAEELVSVADKLCGTKDTGAVFPDFVKLLDLLQIIAGEKNSVRLKIEDSVSGLTGTIIVQKGFLTAAITTNGRIGVEAVAQMLAWNEPSITADKLLSPEGGNISGIPLASAVLQAVVKMDEVINS